MERVNARWMRWTAAVLAVGLLVLAGPVRAAVVRALDLAQLTERSQQIVIAVAQSEAEGLRARIEEVEGGCWIVGLVEAGPPVVEVR